MQLIRKKLERLLAHRPALPLALQEDESIQVIQGGKMYWVNSQGKPRIRPVADFFKDDGLVFDYDMMQTILDDYLMEYKHNITGKDIISVQNQEIRRRLIRRMGYTRFVQDVRGKIIHRDETSQLILIKTPRGQEDMVFVRVVCPSTHDTYILRVPPHVKTCRQAVAWTFGMTEEDYHPQVET